MLVSNAWVFVMGTTLATIVATIAGPLVRPLIERWVSYGFETRLEALRYRTRVHEQAAKVAEYLAIHRTLDAGDPKEVYERINQLVFELAFYLPSGLYREVRAAAVGEGNTLDAVAAVRRHLQSDRPLSGDGEDLTGDDLVWHAPNVGRRR